MTVSNQIHSIVTVNVPTQVKLYDRKTAHSYTDPWVGHDTSYKTPDLDSPGLHTNVGVTTAYIGSPEKQGYVDVWTCDHPLARQWCIARLDARVVEARKVLETVAAERNRY